MKKNAKIFISTDPFGEVDPTPIELLEKSGLEYVINPLKRKLTPEEVGEFTKDCDGLIAGTENIDIVLKKADHLKIISRVGIGLDSVPLDRCRERGIKVSYTPDAVTMAVVELTIGLMICLTRHVVKADIHTRQGNWSRLQGKRIGESVIGLIGFGRIGSNIARLLKEFHPKKILINDLKDKSAQIGQFQSKSGIALEQVDKERIYRESDIVSLHIPFTAKTENLINADTLTLFKNDAYLLNTARGGLVNEADLYHALKKGGIAGAAIDAFEQEPYTGPLTELENIILTQHMGSCSFDCRSQMEIQATEDLIRYFKGEPLSNEVPEEEYDYQRA
jgi:D-3-phosphoglycerate dehydrogenase / 2-oxoglutarate reductase